MGGEARATGSLEYREGEEGPQAGSGGSGLTSPCRTLSVRISTRATGEWLITVPGALASPATAREASA